MSEVIQPTYKAKVEQVISGDDMIIMAELAMDDLFKKVRCRLDGVDTPDAYREPAESEAGKVRDQVRQMVSNAQCVVTVVSQSRRGWKIVLHIHKGGEVINLNEHLQAQGYVFTDKADGRNQAKETQTQGE